MKIWKSIQKNYCKGRHSQLWQSKARLCQDKTSFEKDAIENLTSRWGLHQMMKEAYILDSFLCIYLIFKSQPNFIIESYIQIVAIRQFLQNFIQKLYTLHLIYRRFGTLKIVMLNSSDEQLMNSKAFLNNCVNKKVKFLTALF